MKQNWTTNNIPDLSGKVMVVTGGDSSLGYEIARTFALKGSTTVIACRDIETGERIRKEIISQKEDAIVVVMPLELGDQLSVEQFAAAFNKAYDRLDVLMNISDQPGHIALTRLLLARLASTPASRVVNLSLGEHKLKQKDFKRILRNNSLFTASKKKIGGFRWSNMVFTYELQRSFDQGQVNCRAVAAYPGPANRNLMRRVKNQWYWRLFKPVYKLFTGPDPRESALPGIRAALAGNVQGGEYFGPGGFVEVNGYKSYNAVLHFVA
ncbi:MAG TPA: SDR family NAD(P)-dependent oxidoreductase [Bacteroidales bacterium]|nr:SDR family NAD(P)-dependent oxidoreductase [Bacteroidales bacterium]